MRLLGQRWTPATADAWTRHDLVAALLSPVVFVALALGATRVLLGDARGWPWVALGVGASLLLWAVIDPKLRAQSRAFARREAEHKRRVDERNRWEGRR